MVKCNTCGATYELVQADGTRYFHACAPVWDDTKKAVVERPNKRDENVVQIDVTKAGVSKSDGAGVTKL